MFFRRVTRGSAEQIYVVCRNATTVSCPIGGAAVWAYSLHTTYGDGVNICRPVTGDQQWQLAGVCVRQPIYPGDFGLLQVYGFCDYALVTKYGAADWDWGSVLTSVCLITPDTWRLFPVTSAVVATGVLEMSSAKALVFPCTTLLEGQATNTDATSGVAKVFLRLL